MRHQGSALTMFPHAAPAVDASAQQENLFAFIDYVMQQAVPPSADARAEAAAAHASAPQDVIQSPAVIPEGRSDVKADDGITAERWATFRPGHV